MEDKWVKFEDVEFSNHQIYHCDTRDFHILVNDEISPTTKEFIEDFLEIPNSNKNFVIDVEKIKPLLSNIRVWMREHHEIVLKLNNPNRQSTKYFKGWLKYLRFYKVGDGKYLTYTTSGREYYPIYWREILDNLQTFNDIIA